MIFPRLDIEKEIENLDKANKKLAEEREKDLNDWIKQAGKKLNKNEKEEESTIVGLGKEEITLEDFEKLDLRVATIESVEDHPNADKLYILNLKLGQEKRTIVSGIKDYYKKDDLIGKQIIIVANLKPIKLRGVESKGMLLAAKDKNGNLSLASLMDKIEDGVSLG